MIIDGGEDDHGWRRGKSLMEEGMIIDGGEDDHGWKGGR